MKLHYFLLVLLFHSSCANENYYSDEHFEFSENQNKILSLYKENDTITFKCVNKDTTHSIVIKDGGDYKHNTYTNFGINRLIQRSKSLYYIEEKDTLVHSFIECSVFPHTKEKEITINYPDGYGFFHSNRTLEEFESKAVLGNHTFEKVFELPPYHTNEIRENDISLIYISYTKGFIGYKLKNGEAWLNTKFASK